MRYYDDTGYIRYEKYLKQHRELTSEIRRLQRALLAEAQDHFEAGRIDESIQTLKLLVGPR